MSKRAVALAVLVPLALIGGSAAQPWLTGVSTDPILGRATVTATGGQVVPAAPAVLLVVGAALLALLTGGARVRQVGGAVVALAGAGVAALVAGVLAAPGDALGRRAAELAGRAGALVPVEARVTPWPYAAGLAALALAAAGVLAVVTSRRWSGLSARFDRTDADAGPGEARRTAWDALSEGHDPTRDENAEPT